jgi:hypothetical protein
VLSRLVGPVTRGNQGIADDATKRCVPVLCAIMDRFPDSAEVQEHTCALALALANIAASGLTEVLVKADVLTRVRRANHRCITAQHISSFAAVLVHHFCSWCVHFLCCCDCASNLSLVECSVCARSD